MTLYLHLLVLGIAGFSALLSLIGLVFVLSGPILLYFFLRRRSLAATSCPAISVMIPLCGSEPQLMEALLTLCRQSYPLFQIVFGVQDRDDPAILVVNELRRSLPACDISLVISSLVHGPNRKIGNLINMMSAARHDVLVFADSDLHVLPDYLQSVMACLEQPNVGLVTTVCSGLATSDGLVASLGVSAINYSFLPGVLLARMLGRQDCLGTTMALRRKTLTQAGGLEALVHHLADDNLLGQLVCGLGLNVGLATTIPSTAVPEISLRALWLHELRWARTISSLEPRLFAASIVQFPLFWAATAVVFSGCSLWSTMLFLATWFIRAAAAKSIDRKLSSRDGLVHKEPIWLMPLRDVMSVGRVFASFLGTQVVWRGHILTAAIPLGRETSAGSFSSNGAYRQVGR